MLGQWTRPTVTETDKPGGSHLPAELEVSGFTTIEDDQTEARIRLFRVDADDSVCWNTTHPATEHIETLVLEDIREAKAGSPLSPSPFGWTSAGSFGPERGIP